MSFISSKSLRLSRISGLIISSLTLSSAMVWAESMPAVNPNAQPIILPPPPEPKEASIPRVSAAPVTASAPLPLAPVSKGSVARATFTTTIVNKEPANQVSRVNTGEKVYYFTELVGLQGHTITHRWERNGSAPLSMTFPVGGQRWRVQSSKTLNADNVGNWTVTVQAEEGTILRKDNLMVEAGQAPAPTPVIPPSATPLTPIPPALSKEPASRPANTPAPVMSSPIEAKPSASVTDSSKKADSPSSTPEKKASDTTKDSSATTPKTGKPIWESL